MKMRAKRAAVRTLAAAGRCLPRDPGLLILYYHSVSPTRRYETNVAPDAFRRQMEILLGARRPVRLADAAGRLARGVPCPGEAVVTFDDGYADNAAYAVPVLREMNIPATIFLSVGYVGTDRILPHDAADDPAANRLLTWEEVAAAEGPLVSFGSHTMSHCRLAAAGTAAREEILRSMEVLRSRLSAADVPFSYPYGTGLDFLPVHERMVREAGFCCACSAVFGVNRPGADLFALRRVGVDASDDESTFRAKVDGRLGLLGLKDAPAVKRAIRAATR